MVSSHSLMKKKSRTITPAILLDHMRGMETRLQGEMKDMGTGMKGLRTEMQAMESRLTRKMDGLEYQIDAVAERLDSVEIHLHEEKKLNHERRITRLEGHTGLLAA